MDEPHAAEGLVAPIAALLTDGGKTIAAAESCTGGLLSALLTSAAGSSSYFIGGVVSYHPSVKAQELDVPAELLRESGAVSEEAARRMAQGIRRKYHTDFGVGVTGITGPGGGTIQKPVGLVYAAVCSKNDAAAAKFQFRGGRGEIRNQACLETLRLMMRKLLEWKTNVP